MNSTLHNINKASRQVLYSLHLGKLIRPLVSNAGPKRSLKLDTKILVGTHHKSGTVWLTSIFKRISNKFDLDLFVANKAESTENFDIFVHEHSEFNFDNIQFDYRGIHIVRDPRDIIISGCFYHTKSKEEWLHIKRPDFGGLTYQEKINSYSSIDDQIAFEMENSGLRNISRMCKWNYDNSKFMEVKYENLILDSDLFLFHRLFTFLGFPGEEIPSVLRLAYDASIFSGKVKKSNHVRSGKSGQWRKYFSPSHAARFVELHGDVLIRMGYENDNSWAEKDSLSQT